MLLKDHYVVKMIAGKKCFVQAQNELTKNHRENDMERADGAIIVEQSHSKCPILIFEKYLSKLQHDCPYLWQLPLSNYTCDGKWYGRKSGDNSIKQFMKKICKICNLSKLYTNHCVRATTCTILSSSHSDIDIQSVSGHKSLCGLSQYKRINDSKKMIMSQTMSNSLGLASKPADQNFTNSQCNLEKDVHNNCCLSLGVANNIQQESYNKAEINTNVPSLAQIQNFDIPSSSSALQPQLTP
jgi:hypothetical protein